MRYLRTPKFKEVSEWFSCNIVANKDKSLLLNPNAIPCDV